MKIPEITIQQLLEAGVHLGHKTLRWNPKMKKYIFGKKDSIHIIDLTQTLELTQVALEKVYKTISENGKILFISTKRGARGFIHHDESTHCTLKTREQWVEVINEYAVKKAIPVVLATDYTQDTFDHNGKGMTYDHWNMPQELVDKIKYKREVFYKSSPERIAEGYSWELTNSNFEV